MTNLDENLVRRFRQMMPDYIDTEDAWSGKTDGSAPTTGLTGNYIWVHSLDQRTQRVVRNNDPVAAAVYGTSVTIGFHRKSQEYHVVRRNPAISNKVPGNPTITDVSFLKPENIAAGYVFPNPENGGLSVFISPFRYPGGAWEGGSLTLTPTATSGMKAQVLVGVNMLTNAAAQELGDDAPDNAMYVLRPTDADVTRVMAENPHIAWRTAVTLANGATSFAGAEFKSIGHWAVTEPKHNFIATAAPGVDDDIDAGYSVGSQWFYATLARLYICSDTTAGAAVWNQIASVGGGGSLVQWDQAVGTSDISTTSTTFTDMTDMSITMTTGANTIEVHFSAGVGHNTNNGTVEYQLVIDGTPVSNTQTSRRIPQNTVGAQVHLTYMQTMTAASHTIKVQWKVNANTGYNRAAAGTEHRILTVKEF